MEPFHLKQECLLVYDRVQLLVPPFLFYINDLESIVSKVKLFADDTIIYNNADMPTLLQDNLTALKNWELKWDMGFYLMRFEYLTFSRKRKQANNNYELHKISIPKAFSTRCPGIHADSRLKPGLRTPRLLHVF